MLNLPWLGDFVGQKPSKRCLSSRRKTAAILFSNDVVYSLWHMVIPNLALRGACSNRAADARDAAILNIGSEQLLPGT